MFVLLEEVMQSRTDMEEEELTRRREIEGENLRSAFNEAAGIKDELNKDQCPPVDRAKYRTCSYLFMT